jgi:hypothetical protein
VPVAYFEVQIVDHLHMFNLVADLTKAYDEPLYLSADLFKSAKESYSEDRAAFAFDNSFGKDVPGVAAGATYDKDDKKKARKKKEDKDLDKGITGWDVAEGALLLWPPARGAKVAHKIASVGFKSKQLMAPIRKLYGVKMAKDYSAAIAKGTRHVEKFLVGLANTKPMKQLGNFTDDAIKTIASLNSGKHGSAAVKAVGDYFKFASTKGAGSHRFLGRTSEMARQGVKITPAQRVITNLELSAAKGSPTALFRGTPLARYIKGGTKGGTKGARAGGSTSSLRRHESYRKGKRLKPKRKFRGVRGVPGVAGGKKDTQSISRQMVSEGTESRKGPALYVKAGGSTKGSTKGSVKGKTTQGAVSSAKSGRAKLGERYRYSGDRPETWKEVRAEAKERV